MSEEVADECTEDTKETPSYDGKKMPEQRKHNCEDGVSERYCPPRCNETGRGPDAGKASDDASS